MPKVERMNLISLPLGLCKPSPSLFFLLKPHKGEFPLTLNFLLGRLKIVKKMLRNFLNNHWQRSEIVDGNNGQAIVDSSVSINSLLSCYGDFKRSNVIRIPISPYSFYPGRSCPLVLCQQREHQVTFKDNPRCLERCHVISKAGAK